MIFHWSTGATQVIPWGTVVTGLQRNGERPISLELNADELDSALEDQKYYRELCNVLEKGQ